MKKILKTLICCILPVVMIVSMAACSGNHELQEKYNDLMARLERQEEKFGQQDEMLKQQEEKIKELQEKDNELERKNKALEEKIRELENDIGELSGSIAHEVGVIGTEGSFWGAYDGPKAQLLRSKEELNSYLTDLDRIYGQSTDPYDYPPNTIPRKWGMRYKEGRFDYDGAINGDKISEWYDESYFNSKALIFCFFYSPNLFWCLESHRVYIDNSTLQVKIKFRYGEATAIDYVAVLLEVGQSDVRNITETHLETTSQ